MTTTGHERIADAGMAIGFAAVAILLLGWQDGPVQWSTELRRWLAACGLLFGFLIATAIRLRVPGASRAEPAAGALPQDLPVIHASQTGFGETLARRTVQSLRAGGVAARAVPIGAVDAALLQRTPRALFILSTTGEGDPPDAAVGLLRSVLDRRIPLPDLHYGLLALGDRDYANFCAFGHRVDQWLRRQGARALFDPVEVDDGDAGALRRWVHHLRQLCLATDLPDWETPRYTPWILTSRTHVNPGSEGGAAFHLALTPTDGGLPAWEAGDLVEIGPRHPEARVAVWLERTGLEGDTWVEQSGMRRPLRDALACSQLPEPATIAGRPVQEVATELERLPHRDYSIASLPGDGRIELMVRRQQRADGSLGLGSGWLTAHALVGSAIDLRIRANPGFRPPEDGRPLLLIGNGTGLAGLCGLVKVRAARGHLRNWLVFGERTPGTDDFFADDLRRWEADGTLARCDRVWSRGGSATRHVQHRLLECDAMLRSWVASGAAIHVCGSRVGMAAGVDANLRAILGSAEVDALLAAGRYRRDVY